MDGASGGRAKRQKVDKHGRLSALEKLRQLKGSKRKYELDTLENVYDTVEENEYADRVLQRQQEDWIEDDDGCGYVEDGREIFDDEEAETSTVMHNEKLNTNSAKKRKTKALSNMSSNHGKGSLHNMFNNMTAKKKEDVKLSEDDILSDIMSEIKPQSLNLGIQKSSQKTTPSNNKVKQSHTFQNSKREAQDYFRSLNSNIPTTKNKVTVTNIQENSKSKIEIEDECIVESEPQKENLVQNILKESKVTNNEIETPTQNIEEYNTQDLHFDGIDFDSDSLQEIPIKQENCESETNVKPLVLNKNEIKKEIDCVTSQTIKKENSTIEACEASRKFVNPGQISNSIQSDVEFDSNSFPYYTYKDGSKSLRFYWLDAWEDRFVKPGVVFLFGKVYIDHSNPSKGSVSICVVVRNVDRKMFLLPREYKLDPVSLEDTDHLVSMKDVYDEFNENVVSKLGIKEPKCQPVTKNYAFELPDIPIQSEYLEVRYSAKYNPPPTDKKYLTFSHIFGINTSYLEILLLEKKIKGPCWLEIKNPESVSSKISWCKSEANCAQPDDIIILRDEQAPPPPLVVATLHTRTLIDPKSKLNTIAMLSILVTTSCEINKPPPNPQFQQHFCIITRMSNCTWPIDINNVISQYKETKLTKCDSERALLSYFLVQLWKIDPDIILGHDLYGYQQDLLINNIVNKNIPNWSRLGRLKRSVVPQRKFLSKDAFMGRLVCDVKLSAMELIRSRSYDLDTLCTNVLKLPENSVLEYTSDEIIKYYDSVTDLLELVSLTMQETTLILRLMFELNVLPLALQITQIAGNVMSRTLMGGRSERNEFLLLHAFTEKGYIVPDKASNKKEMKDDAKNSAPINSTEESSVVSKGQSQSRKKPTYLGGLVLDPKKGFYDNFILLMDFNSLYPSIIQEYNICFTTIKRNAITSSDDEITELALPDSDVEPGILPIQIRKLVESRREVKKLMKIPDLYPDQYMQYNIRQMALKLTANSMYGCLGFAHSRFYAKPLAALVTLKGREILTDTKDLVSRLNYDVIYGDTDSIMINTKCLDYDKVFKIGYEIKREINKKYKHVELDIDGVFRYMLLLKKKKYAAVSVSKNKNGEFVSAQELKGLDIVRRDWSQLAAEAGKFILNQILSEQSPDDRIENIQIHLMKLTDDLINGKIPLSLLIITKQLTKNPMEYADKNGQPHVQVVLRLNSKGGRRYKKGDIVPYLICEDGTGNSAIQRAYHVEELKNSNNLKIDTNYYLSQQLHPVISRICDPIDGLDSARIADFLGLDPSAYKQSVKKESNENSDVFLLENERDKFRDCERFSFICGICKYENKIKEVFRTENKGTFAFLEKCQNESCNSRPMDYLPKILNQLNLKLRSYVAKYYENWLICEDPACVNRTVKLPHCFAGGYPLCNLCEKGVMFREYTEKELYNQLCFFQYFFDITKQNVQKIKLHPQILSGFHSLKECVEDALSHSAYSVINLEALFSFFNTNENNSTVMKNEPFDLNLAPDIDLDDHNFELDMCFSKDE